MAQAAADAGLPRSRAHGAAPRGDGAGAFDDDERDDGEEDGVRSGAPLGFVPLAGRSALGGDDGLDGLLDFEDGVEEELEEEVRCGRACHDFREQRVRKESGGGACGWCGLDPRRMWEHEACWSMQDCHGPGQPAGHGCGAMRDYPPPTLRP